MTIMHRSYGVLLGVVLFFGVFFLFTPFGLLLIMSESLPQKLFISFKSLKVARGDYAYFSHPHFNQVLVKRVIGLAGDRVTRKGLEVYVNDTPVGTLRPACSTGKELTPVAEQLIPPGKYFVAGVHQESYDSRYEEFGLVNDAQLLGKVWPLY